jgi:hypothetical protein
VRRIAAFGALTDKVTGRLMLLPAPAIVMAPLYVPGGREPGVAVTVSEAGDDGAAAPPAAELLSQGPPEEVAAEAVKSTDPLPVFVTCNCWARALPP